MKRSCFSEEQIIAILKEQVWRAERIRCPQAQGARGREQ